MYGVLKDVDVFEAEPPLPKNDFRRMVNFWKGTGGEGFRGSKQVSGNAIRHQSRRC